MERAKELFLKYAGNRFFMDHDGEGAEYAGYHVSKETEERWAKEYILDFLESERRGKEALRVYSAVAELLRCDRRDDYWEKCLYYPLRAAQLDDVTVLFMLSVSLRLAEKAVKKQTLSREGAEVYIKDLDGYTKRVMDRFRAGTFTRSPDYVMREFSDPAYVEEYLKELREKWTALF